MAVIITRYDERLICTFFAQAVYHLKTQGPTTTTSGWIKKELIIRTGVEWSVRLKV